MPYFISQESDQGFRIEPDLFVRKLRANWPGTVVHRISDPTRKYLYEWTLQTEAGNLEGKLEEPLVCVVLEGILPGAAAFAVWFQREIAGRDENLKFYDENYDPVVTLTSETSADDIIRHMARGVGFGAG